MARLARVVMEGVAHHVTQAHLMAAARYVELNPVRAHLEGRDDGLVTVAPLLERETDWRAFLDQGLADEAHQALRAGERTGRPLGSDAFVAALERDLGRPLARRKPGPKPAAARNRGG